MPASAPKVQISLGGFAVANVGAFASFLPLFQILLPLKAAAVAPHAALALLGTVAATGAGVAAAANIVAGWLSDRTRSRFGRRRPWIIGGTLGLVASYAAIWQAHSPTGLLIAVALFQIAFNAMFAPLVALIADHVPAARQGWASALVAFGKPIGAAVGAGVVGGLFVTEGSRYAALGTVVVFSIVPFALRFKDAPASVVRRHGCGEPRRLWSRNFAIGWLSRCLVITAYAVAQIYLLFYVEGLAPAGPRYTAERGVALLAVVYGINSAATALVMGYASDRTGRRKAFVIGGALAVGAGMGLLALPPSWPLAIAAYALFASGAGAHTAVEFALMVELLPSREHNARDLGVLNVSNIVPQVVAPLGATMILALPGTSIHHVFAAAGLAAVAGAGMIGFMRSVA